MGFAQGVENFHGVFTLGSMAPMKAGVGVQSMYTTRRERTFAFGQRPGGGATRPRWPPVEEDLAVPRRAPPEANVNHGSD